MAAFREDNAGGSPIGATPVGEAAKPFGGAHEFAPPEVCGPRPPKSAPAATCGGLTAPPAPMPWFDWLLALAVGGAFCLAVALTWGGYGHSWDEAYYYEPARLAREWTRRMVVDSDKPLSREAIGHYWGGDRVIGSEPFINELPALPKFAWAAGLVFFEDLLGPSRAMRLPVAVAFGLLLMLVYRFGHALGGRWSAVCAAVLLGTMPRVWGEAHLAVAETFASLMFLATVYCFWRGLFSAKWAVAAGVAFGLALNTKVQAVLLPLALLPWAQIYARPRHANATFALLFVAPVVWVATWPWLWAGPAPRILEFFEFYASHHPTPVFYLGQKWNAGGAIAPWHYPWVMTAIVTPPLTLAAFFAGVALTVARARSRPALVLVLICALLPLLFLSLPSQVKYDGARLFGWAFPYVAILAGAALACFQSQLGKSRGERWLARSACALILAMGMWALAGSHPHGLSYFNAIIGGPIGASEFGMEMAYWGEALNDEALRDLNAGLPQGASIKTRALHDRALRQMQEWGMLRADLRIDGEPPYDFLLVQNRRGFWTETDQQRHEAFRRDPARQARVWALRGAPLLYLYDVRE